MRHLMTSMVAAVLAVSLVSAPGHAAPSASSQGQIRPHEVVPQDDRLREIMRNVHRICSEAAEEFGVPGNLVRGANIAGFIKVAKAMVAHGLV